MSASALETGVEHLGSGEQVPFALRDIYLTPPTPRCSVRGHEARIFRNNLLRLVASSKYLYLLLVNAHHIKQGPGRKTDQKDSEWIAVQRLVTTSSLPSGLGCLAHQEYVSSGAISSPDCA
jgi:hypothetical protein